MQSKGHQESNPDLPIFSPACYLYATVAGYICREYSSNWDVVKDSNMLQMVYTSLRKPTVQTVAYFKK